MLTTHDRRPRPGVLGHRYGGGGGDETFCTFTDVILDEARIFGQSFGAQSPHGHHTILQYTTTPRSPTPDRAVMPWTARGFSAALAARPSKVPFTAAEDLAARRRELARRSGLPPPKPVLPPPERTRFIADPLSDGALLSLGVGVGALSEAILFTGELTPQAPGDPSKLLSIDRGAVDQASDPGWVTVGSVGLLSAFGFAAVDPVLSGFRSGSEAGIVDAFIYGETLSITWATTNILKIAFRRPRPSAYREARALRDAGVPQEEIASRITDTNSALSFVSGHASVTAGVAATASYLAFSRAPGTPRPWITMGAGGVVTALTSLARVRSGDHFPTDVIAGSMVGFGIGILVPHAHRAESATRRPVWIGAAPADDGGFVTVSGLF